MCKLFCSMLRIFLTTLFKSCNNNDCKIFMLNYTLSIFGFILYEIAFIPLYKHCWLSSSLQRFQFMQILCRITLQCDTCFLRAKQNRKGMGVWNSMFILLTVFSMAWKKANKVASATNLTQLHKVLRFCTIYLQLVYAVSLAETLLGL